MSSSAEKFILMQLIKDSEWVPDEAQRDNWHNRVLYKVGHIPVYKCEMPGTQEDCVDHVSADKEKNPVAGEDTKTPSEGKNSTTSLTPNKDNIDYRIKRNLNTSQTGGNGVLSLLHSLIDTCLHDAEEIIDLNNFWEYAEK